MTRKRILREPKTPLHSTREEAPREKTEPDAYKRRAWVEYLIHIRGEFVNEQDQSMGLGGACDGHAAPGKRLRWPGGNE